MSYLVLARKWRPRRFAELVGQEHVVRALTNALQTGRVHHAFLFTGTRGVGKTTIARIFAKSLNCEQGTSADPCGECNSCRDIDAGRFIDLLEIDAASNTGVDDVREVIDNAQYMPSRGRVKVYLIDEVHMLSKSAFNALLKTLEEPPGHVKFLLATTDPQKLPVTVLSRCLQFNLKRLDEAQIGGQITRILAAEGIEAESGAIRQLSKAADGSLRDGLSLLDQAIAYTGGQLGDAAVATMLGTVDRTRVGALLAALAEGSGQALLDEVAALAEFSPDWGSVLEAITEALHRVQVRQLVPEAALESDGVDIDALAERLRPELVQLWYQMAVNGRRDLPLAPSPRAGFEMAVLRMLAFRPAAPGEAGAGSAGAGSSTPGSSTPGSSTPGSAAPVADPGARRAPPSRESLGLAPAGHAAAAAAAALQEPARAPAAPVVPPPVAVRAPAPAPARVVAAVAAQPPAADDDVPWHVGEPPVPASLPEPVVVAASAAPVSVATSPLPTAVPAPASPPAAATPEPAPLARLAEPSAPITMPRTATARGIADADAWHDLVAGSALKGPAKVLAEHAGFLGFEDGVLRLSLSAEDEMLNTPVSLRMVAQALAAALGGEPQIRFETAAQPSQSLRQRNERARDQRQAAAEEAFLGDADVQRLIAQGARVVPDSIRPLDD